MQNHILRSAEHLHHFFSPVGIHVSHYQGSHKRRQMRSMTGPSATSAPGTNVPVSHEQGPPVVAKTGPSAQTATRHRAAHNRTGAIPSTSHNLVSGGAPPGAEEESEHRWSRESLSLLHPRNRRLYRGLKVRDIDAVLLKLHSYGFETSTDIARMQPWQLRVLKREIPQVDGIYLQAFPMWGKKEYYDELQNKMFRQFVDVAVWLEHNEIHLILKGFDARNYGFRCFVCGCTGIGELDALRWHLWVQHRGSLEVRTAMEETKHQWFTNERLREQLSALEAGQHTADTAQSRRPRRGKQQSVGSSATGKSEVIDLVDSDSEEERAAQRRVEAERKEQQQLVLSDDLNMPLTEDPFPFEAGRGSDAEDTNMVDVAMELGVSASDFGIFSDAGSYNSDRDGFRDSFQQPFGNNIFDDDFSPVGPEDNRALLF